MKEKVRTPAELRRDGWKALASQLGPADALRFLAEYSTGKGDYTKERRQWVAKLTDEQLLAGLRQQVKRRNRRRKAD